MRFRQEALKEAYKLTQKAWQLDGKPQQDGFLQQNTWAQVSLLVPEKACKHCAGSFLNRVYSLIKSLFSSRPCSTSLCTHISKGFTKFLGLHIFLTLNEKQPGWSCEYCPCCRDLLSLKILEPRSRTANSTREHPANEAPGWGRSCSNASPLLFSCAFCGGE